MVDPFLLEHEVAPRCYDLGGRLTPVSIRDQMIRGRLIVDRAMEQRPSLIAQGGPGLLVVGAGATGVTAAIHAARHGIRTVLIEQEAIPFSRQAGCRSRWLDPTQYDWPVEHWDRGKYPWTNPRMPLPWNANQANRLAIAWTHELNRAGRGLPNLSVHYGTTLIGPPAHLSDGQLLVHFRGRLPADTFGMMVTSVGFGTEDCSVNDYRGFTFWETDPYAKPNAGVQSQIPANVLISGGGDGALQDFLRVVTRVRSAKDLYDQLIGPMQIDSTRMIARLQAAEDQAQRAYSWGEHRGHDHIVFAVLHRVYEDIISELAQNTAAWIAMGENVDALISSMPRITLAYPCFHFGKCYGLNRFLVLLLTRYLARHHPSMILLRPNTHVVEIIGLGGHICALQPQQCHGEPHAVTFAFKDCHGRGLTAQSDPDGRDYHAIIIRHGVTPAVSTLPPVSRSRQMLPYHIPG